MMPTAWVAVLTAILPLAAGQSGLSDLQSIQRALAGEKYETALDLTRSAIRTRPKDVQLKTMEGIVLGRLGRHGEALSAYKEALQVAPSYLPALEGAAEVEYKTGNPEAVVLLNRILKLRPGEQTAHAMLGAIAFRRKDCSSAIQHFSASKELIRSNPLALEENGTCLVRMKRLDDAATEFQKVLTLGSRDRVTRLKLGVIYTSAGKHQQALNALEPLLNSTTLDPEALDLAANAYERLGNTPAAIAALRQAIVLVPDKERYYLDFATICFTHSSYQAGIDMLTSGLVRLPKAASVYLMRGILYVQQSRYDEGEADFETAERLDPHQAFVPDVKGLAQMQSKGADQALVTIRTQLKRHPDDAFLHTLLAEVLLQNGASVGTGEFREASEAAVRAVKLNPNLTGARDILGNIYLKSGKTQLAIEQCRQALRIDPSDQVALYRLVQALRRTNQQQEVPSLLNKLAALREAARKKEAEEHRYKIVEQEGLEGISPSGRID